MKIRRLLGGVTNVFTSSTLLQHGFIFLKMFKRNKKVRKYSFKLPHGVNHIIVSICNMKSCYFIVHIDLAKLHNLSYSANIMQIQSVSESTMAFILQLTGSRISISTRDYERRSTRIDGSIKAVAYRCWPDL